MANSRNCPTTHKEIKNNVILTICKKFDDSFNGLLWFFPFLKFYSNFAVAKPLIYL